MLLDAGEDVDVKNKGGKTPLHVAVEVKTMMLYQSYLIPVSILKSGMPLDYLSQRKRIGG
jgi:ankyrin repeat protein